MTLEYLLEHWAVAKQNERLGSPSAECGGRDVNKEEIEAKNEQFNLNLDAAEKNLASFIEQNKSTNKIIGRWYECYQAQKHVKENRSSCSKQKSRNELCREISGRSMPKTNSEYYVATAALYVYVWKRLGKKRKDERSVLDILTEYYGKEHAGEHMITETFAGEEPLAFDKSVLGAFKKAKKKGLVKYPVLTYLFPKGTIFQY